MRILRWMCGKARKDYNRIENNHEMVRVAPLEVKLRENRLRWFCHVQQRLVDVIIWTVIGLMLMEMLGGREDLN